MMALWLGYRESAAGMGIAALISGVLYVLTRPEYVGGLLDRLELLEGWGLKAKLRSTIKEADEAIVRLNKLATTVAGPLYTIMARMGRWGSGIPRAERALMIEQLDGVLRDANVQQEQIDALKETVHHLNMWDLASSAITKLQSRFQQLGNDQMAVVERMTQPIPADDAPKVAAALAAAQARYDLKEKVGTVVGAKPYRSIAERLEGMIVDAALLSPEERRELIDLINPELIELRHYVEHMKFKDKDAWIAAERQ